MLSPAAFRGGWLGAGWNNPVRADLGSVRDASLLAQGPNPASRDALHLGPLGGGEVFHDCTGLGSFIGTQNRGHAVVAPRAELLDSVVFADAESFDFAPNRCCNCLGGALADGGCDDAVVITDAAGLVCFASFEFAHLCLRLVLRC